MGKNDAASHLNHHGQALQAKYAKSLLLPCHPAPGKTADFRKALAKAGDPVFQRQQ
jgi:hypothetical protein